MIQRCQPSFCACFASFHSTQSLFLSLYQIQIRSGPEGEVLTNEAGEVTSHLQGMFYRTIALLDKGIKPVFVFDGKPPVLKGGEVRSSQQIYCCLDERNIYYIDKMESARY